MTTYLYPDKYSVKLNKFVAGNSGVLIPIYIFLIDYCVFFQVNVWV